MPLWAVSLLVMAAGYCVVMSLMQYTVKNRLLIEQRLAVYSPEAKVEGVIQEELSRPMTERLLKPLLNRVSAMTTKMIPGGTFERLNNKLVQAGNPWNLSPQEFMGIKIVSMALLPGALFATFVLFSFSLGDSWMLLLVSGILGYILPDMVLKYKVAERKEEIRRSLPDVLDLLTVSVEAGLGFDAALAKVVEKMEGSLPEELGRMLQEIKMGKPRKEAMKDLRDRIGVEDLSNFISSVIQADQLGVSIGSVLRLQAGENREKRRQAAQEKAMKAPVKMVIPMVLFIFPAIFIVLLGPALLKIIDSLGSM